MTVTQMRGVSTTCVNKQNQMFEHHINSNGYMYLRLIFYFRGQWSLYSNVWFIYIVHGMKFKWTHITNYL